MHDLATFLTQAGEELASEYARIVTRATEDPGTAGDEGEENWAALLREWLPGSYHVTTKGRIMSVDGELSPQVDVIVLKPSYPPKLRDKKVYLAGGVAAAFECKTTLKKRHLEEAVDTARILKRLGHPLPPRSTRQGTPYVELHSAIFFGVLAHSATWVPQTARNHVTDLLNAGLSSAAHPSEVLDGVCVADLGYWSTMRTAYSGPLLSHWNLDQQRKSYPDGYASCAVIAPPEESLFGTVSPKVPEIPVAQLCSALYSRLAWEDETLRSVSDYFRVAGMMGRGSGRSRAWPLRSVYSEGVLTNLSRELRFGNVWSPWSVVFI